MGIEDKPPSGTPGEAGKEQTTGGGLENVVSEEAARELILGAKSLDALCDVITELGGLQGSSEFYSADELIDLIKDCRTSSLEEREERARLITEVNKY